MSLFEGLSSAKLSESGTFFKPGLYEIEIEKCIAKQTRASGTCFIVECRVLKSTNPEMPEGSKGTWLQKMNPTEIAFPAIKAFAYAVTDVDTTDKKAMKDADAGIEEFMGAAVNDNALSGEKLRLEVVKVTTKKGADFHRHNWSPAAK